MWLGARKLELLHVAANMARCCRSPDQSSITATHLPTDDHNLDQIQCPPRSKVFGTLFFLPHLLLSFSWRWQHIDRWHNWGSGGALSFGLNRFFMRRRWDANINDAPRSVNFVELPIKYGLIAHVIMRTDAVTNTNLWIVRFLLWSMRYGRSFNLVYSWRYVCAFYCARHLFMLGGALRKNEAIAMFHLFKQNPSQISQRFKLSLEIWSTIILRYLAITSSNFRFVPITFHGFVVQERNVAISRCAISCDREKMQLFTSKAPLSTTTQENYILINVTSSYYICAPFCLFQKYIFALLPPLIGLATLAVPSVFCWVTHLIQHDCPAFTCLLFHHKTVAMLYLSKSLL